MFNVNQNKEHVFPTMKPTFLALAKHSQKIRVCVKDVQQY